VAALYSQSVSSGELTRRIADRIADDEAYASTFGEALVAAHRVMNQ
jgi:hypothetical protein